jgi:hypothetical protein
VAPRFAVVWLLAAGIVLLGGGLTAIVVGTWLASWLYGLLPPVTIDASAVGGAATASGTALVGIGALHVAGGILLRRGAGAALTPAVVLAATMGLLSIGWGVAALVSAASGGGPPGLLVPVGIGLGLVAAGYGWAARGLIGLREHPEGRS